MCVNTYKLYESYDNWNGPIHLEVQTMFFEPLLRKEINLLPNP